MEGVSIQIQEEILLARQSREEGNEGRARVCARRAAGAAARQLLEREGYPMKDENVLDSLGMLRAIDPLPERVQIAIDRLLERVDEFSNLPPGIDLIQEAEIVIQFSEPGQMG